MIRHTQSTAQSRPRWHAALQKKTALWRVAVHRGRDCTGDTIDQGQRPLPLPPSVYCSSSTLRHPVDRLLALSAARIQAAAGLSAKDALHVAAAEHAKAAWFVTCDDEIVSKAGRLPVALLVINPVDYVQKRW